MVESLLHLANLFSLFVLVSTTASLLLINFESLLSVGCGFKTLDLLVNVARSVSQS